MTRADALRAARALLDGMAGTTDGEWGDPADVNYGNFGWYVPGCPAGETEDTEQGRIDAAHIARSCPARLGPVLRALMEGD